MSARRPPDASALGAANRYCAALARAQSRDQWLGALYAEASARDALNALAAFDHEIRHAVRRSRDPNLAAMRLAWWRGAIAGERQDEAAGSPVALALSAAIDAYALPARLHRGDAGRAPAGNRAAGRFQPRRISRLRRRERGRAAEARGADRGRRGRTGSGRRARAGRDGAGADAYPHGELPFKAGSAPTLIPADVAARHGASPSDFDARRASAGVIAACAELRGLARDELAEAERRLNGSEPSDPARVHSARAVAARPRSARPQRRAPVRAAQRSLAAPSAMGDLALGAANLTRL